jgi:hypothetical protein
MEGVAVTQAHVLLINSQHVSVQRDHHQAILEYTNGDGIHTSTHYNATAYFC